MLRAVAIADARRVRVIAIFFVVVMAAGVVALPASAEVRTGFGDRVADGGDSGSPSVPALRSLRVIHDTPASTLAFEVTFARPVVDSASSSALRSTELQVWVGDAYGPPAACQAGEYDLSTVVLPLGDDNTLPSLSLAPENPDFPREKRGPAPIAGARAWNADRTVLTLRFTDRRIATATWICAGASSSRTTSAEGSYLRSFMLDGFTPYDGRVQTTIADLMLLNGMAARTRCITAAPPDTWRCPSVTLSAFASIPDQRGRRVRLSGIYGFQTHGSARYPTFRAFGRLTGTVTWSRCPRRLRANRSGRRCSIPVTWTGGDLALVVQRAVARRMR